MLDKLPITRYRADGRSELELDRARLHRGTDCVHWLAVRFHARVWLVQPTGSASGIREGAR